MNIHPTVMDLISGIITEPKIDRFTSCDSFINANISQLDLCAVYLI